MPNGVDASTALNNNITQELAHLRKSSLALISTSPVFRQLQDGNLHHGVYTRYMLNVYQYAQHSAIVIGMAGARAVPRSEKVGRYLLHHAIEETGHEKWAYSDLRDLGLSEEQISQSHPTAHCLGMIGMEYYYAAHQNPIPLLGWMYTLEALGDDVGHLISTKVATGLGLDNKGTYFLSGHGNADHEHIKEITSVIIEDVPKEDHSELLYVAQMSARFYVGLVNDCVKE